MTARRVAGRRLRRIARGRRLRFLTRIRGLAGCGLPATAPLQRPTSPRGYAWRRVRRELPCGMRHRKSVGRRFRPIATGTGTPILDGTACRAAVQADCDGTTTPILDGGVCRARNAADCTTAAAPALDSTSGNCRAATTAAECPFGLPILDGGVCRAATQADCDATPATPVLDAGGCRAPRAGDTFGAYYTFTAGSQLINGRFVVNQPTPEAAATEARRACEAVRAGSIGGLFGNPSACAPDSSAPNGFNGVCINTGEVGPRRFVGYGGDSGGGVGGEGGAKRESEC